MIAQEFATRHPEKTKTVTSIMSTTGKPGLSQATPAAMAALMGPPPEDNVEARKEAFKKTQKVIGSPGYPSTDAELDAMATQMATRSPMDVAAVSRQMVAIMASEPRHETNAAIKAPALVIHGKDDPLVPVDGGEDTASSIPGAKLIVIEGMGHDVTDALAPILVDHIASFIDSAEGGFDLS
jgi:pimeloyl-ACP methyl ester carboxylesterase